MALIRRRSSTDSPSLGTAHARLDQIILLERALREDAREVLRGVSSQHVLADLGSALESSGAHAHKDWYHLSRPCESLDYFVSHSWRQGRWMKTMALAKHLHWKLALLLAALSIVATTAAFPFWAPPDLCTAESDFNADWLRASAIMIIPGVVFLATVLLGQRIIFLRADCFVDKMCINQTDLRLKQHAIKSFDLFLRFSRRMVVLWSPTYLQRLWCVYELATFNRIHYDAASRIEFVTEWGGPFTLGMTLLLTIGGPPSQYVAFCTLPFMSQVFGPVWGYVVNVGVVYILMVIAGSTIIYMEVTSHLQMVNQLRTFRLADAGANSADDVATVHRLIELTWASEPGATDGGARFEAFVRGRLATLVVSWHGEATQLPYEKLLVSYFPILALGLMIAQVCDPGMLAMWGYRVPDDLPAWGLRWVLFSVELWGGVIPIANVCAQRAIVRCVQRGWRPAACVAAGTVAYDGALVALVAVAAITTFEHPHAGPLLPLAGFATLGLLVLATWRRAWGLVASDEKRDDGDRRAYGRLEERAAAAAPAAAADE